LTRVRVLLLVLGLVLYPIAVHTLIMAEAPRAAVLTLVAVSVLYLAVFGLGRLTGTKHWRRGRAGPWLMMYGLLALTGIVNIFTHSVYALFLPPIFINLGLMLVFANTLRAGALPLIERMMRLAYRDALPPPLCILARRLTWMWVFFFGSMALLGAALGLYAPLAVWSLFVNVLYYLLVVLLFLAQHVYRYLRFRQYGAASLWNIIQTVSRDPLWRSTGQRSVDASRDATQACQK